MSRAKSVPPKGVVSGALHQMWLHLVRQPWSAIAVIPTDPSTSAGEVARSLLEVAAFYDLGNFALVDAEHASLSQGSQLAREMVASVGNGARVVAAVEYPMQSAGAVPVIMAVDAALLLVRTGASAAAAIRSTIEIVGRERVLGCVALHGKRSKEHRRAEADLPGTSWRVPIQAVKTGRGSGT